MTDDFTPNEDELRRLLGSADRPRALSDDELTRIRGRVEGLGMTQDPDFSTYTDEELLQAKRSTNKKVYPGAYRKVNRLLRERGFTDVAPEPIWKRLGWKFFAVSAPLSCFLLAYSLLAERVPGKRWE